MKRIVSGSARKRRTSSRSAPITVSRQGTCSARAPKALSRIGRPLRSSARPTKTDAQLLAGRLRPGGGGGEVDPVGDDLVAAPEPAPPGPGGGLGDRDPGGEPVEHPTRPERRRRGGWGAPWSSTRGRCRPPGTWARAPRSSRPGERSARGCGRRHMPARRRSSRRGSKMPPAGEDGEVRDRAVGADTRRCGRAASGSRAARAPPAPRGAPPG